MTTPRDGTQATDEQPPPGEPPRTEQAHRDEQAPRGERAPRGARLAEELRLLLDALAERAEPMLNRFAAGDPDEHTPATCGWCPVCAGMAVLRGERPELAVRAAEHAAGLLAVLRAALADPTQPTTPTQPSTPTQPASSAQAPTPAQAPDPAQRSAQAEHPKDDRVQHIPVRRRDAGDDGEC